MVDLIEKDLMFDGLFSADAALVRLQFGIICDLVNLARTVFPRVLRLEMIPRSVHRNRLYISRDRFRMPSRKFEQELASVSAQFQVSLLNQVVRNLLWNLSPLIGCANDRKGDRALKPTNELIPRGAVFALRAGAD